MGDTTRFNVPVDGVIAAAAARAADDTGQTIEAWFIDALRVGLTDTPWEIQADRAPDVAPAPPSVAAVAEERSLVMLHLDVPNDLVAKAWVASIRQDMLLPERIEGALQDGVRALLPQFRTFWLIPDDERAERDLQRRRGPYRLPLTNDQPNLNHETGDFTLPQMR